MQIAIAPMDQQSTWVWPQFWTPALAAQMDVQVLAQCVPNRFSGGGIYLGCE